MTLTGLTLSWSDLESQKQPKEPAQQAKKENQYWVRIKVEQDKNGLQGKKSRYLKM